MRSARHLAIIGFLFVLSNLTLEECIEIWFHGLARLDPSDERSEPAGYDVPDVGGNVLFYLTGEFPGFDVPVSETCSGFLGQDNTQVGAFLECRRLGGGSGQGEIDASGEELAAEVTLIPHDGRLGLGSSGSEFAITLAGAVSDDETHLAGTWEAPSIGLAGEFIGIRAEDLSGMEAAWGDSTCSGAADLGDAVNTLRDITLLPIDYDVLPCPFVGTGVSVSPAVAPSGAENLVWGDVDCSGVIDARDALRIVLDVAGQDTFDPQCPNVGEAIVFE